MQKIYTKTEGDEQSDSDRTRTGALSTGTWVAVGARL